MDYRIAACLSLSLTVSFTPLVLLYFYPLLFSTAFLSVPFSLVLSIAIFSHILYVRAIADTCKLFQGPYYFASLFVLLLYFYYLSSINPIAIASTHTTPTVTTIHASASTMFSSFMLLLYYITVLF